LDTVNVLRQKPDVNEMMGRELCCTVHEARLLVSGDLAALIC
jgi:hypothetical protein